MNTKPILFLEPVFKQMIWGGNRLGTDFHYPIPGEDTGECWGISAHPNGDAKIVSKPFEGKTLSALWEENRELFGNLKEDRFPLLIKIIDAKADLSIQVHPDDMYAKEAENGSLGKMECWYIIDCPADAKLVLGHNAKDKAELEDMIHGAKWQEFLRYVPIKKGDFIQIDPGTVHAITSGCLLLETQQNSDITYRVYDYDRLSDGKPRELHVEKSIDVINAPEKSADTMVAHVQKLPENTLNELIACKYYKVFKMDVKEEFVFSQEYPFLNMSVIEGSGTINGVSIKKGDHFILPAGYGKVELAGEMEVVASCANVHVCA
ncbi:MAG: mannose-6-phosphate isomerase, class I [Lachnospiraceae bacterium]|nr:mannose-6-phosphate isomerase, class I [Lachnospiraceae bacterium]